MLRYSRSVFVQNNLSMETKMYLNNKKIDAAIFVTFYDHGQIEFHEFDKKKKNNDFT